MRGSFARDVFRHHAIAIARFRYRHVPRRILQIAGIAHEPHGFGRFRGQHNPLFCKPLKCHCGQVFYRVGCDGTGEELVVEGSDVTVEAPHGKDLVSVHSAPLSQDLDHPDLMKLTLACTQLYQFAISCCVNNLQ